MPSACPLRGRKPAFSQMYYSKVVGIQDESSGAGPFSKPILELQLS